MTAFMILLAATQTGEVELRVRTVRRGGKFDLEISGRGGALRGLDLVGLRFRRIGNRAAWGTGAIESRAEGREWGRCAPVTRGRFRHRERFEAPGEIEIRLVTGDGREEAARRVTVGSPADVARVVRRESADLERWIARAESLAADADGDVRDGRSRVPLKGLERLSLSLSDGAPSQLGATSRALRTWVDDFTCATECAGAGEEWGVALSGLSGGPVEPDHAGELLEEIAELFRRERALVLTRAVMRDPSLESAVLRQTLEGLDPQTVETLRSGDVEQLQRLEVRLLRGR